MLTCHISLKSYRISNATAGFVVTTPHRCYNEAEEEALSSLFKPDLFNIGAGGLLETQMKL